MSALGELTEVAVSGIWKIATIVLVAVLIAVLSAGGTGWWMIASARDQALVDLKDAQAENVQLLGAIEKQNSLVEAAGNAKLAADARGLAAQQQAIASARRLDSVLAKVAGVRATTCDEAMPTVKAILEATR
ncbi:hypothetical protein IV454_16440 [Massilia antarctica]|uniref:Chemotaxis protein n=1 Tax=Massilia antarctica TaxID=2765360 RepID=A0AA48WHP2_9BURK|nr:hypothetical protein [Massilia antarctica]QPI52935.1 hypothetical protein IV454_16440 [Massilia antarctica]